MPNLPNSVFSSCGRETPPAANLRHTSESLWDAGDYRPRVESVARSGLRGEKLAQTSAAIWVWFRPDEFDLDVATVTIPA
jgi:hypothetical protein